jgi:hypothetical protein
MSHLFYEGPYGFKSFVGLETDRESSSPGEV